MTICTTLVDEQTQSSFLRFIERIVDARKECIERCRSQQRLLKPIKRRYETVELMDLRGVADDYGLHPGAFEVTDLRGIWMRA